MATVTAADDQQGASGTHHPLSPDTLDFISRPLALLIDGQAVPAANGRVIPVIDPSSGSYPLIMASFKVAPALVCGNSAILKPAEQTPLTAVRLGELCLQAGVPSGVVNVLTGYGETAGAALVRHPGVDKVAFTGSTAVGRRIMREGANTLKRVSLELGGKSPNIVFADADVDDAVQAAMFGIWANAGQWCVAGSRLLVERAIHDQVVELVVERSSSLKVGPGLDRTSEMGPLVSQEQFERVTSYLEIGKAEGAEVALGGTRMDRDGYFVKPTVFTGVRNDMRIAQEEIFGPVLSVIPFDGPDDAVSIGNGTQYGLAAAVWTRDVSKAHRFARALRAGTVFVNSYGDWDVSAPLGGYKQSGFGRELGRQSLDLYSQVKSIFVRL